MIKGSEGYMIRHRGGALDRRKRQDRQGGNGVEMEEVVDVTQISAITSMFHFRNIFDHRFMGALLRHIDENRMRGVDEKRHQQNP